ncbi:MAG: hypothetical protein ACFFG0_46125 [Candidatus Thorarchaeota archaeon]
MNIKKVKTIGLILILSFSILYFPLSYISFSSSKDTNSDNDSIDFTESNDQLNVELSSPIITGPILLSYSDDYFQATFSVMNNWPEGLQHTFRVYAYLDYVRSDTDLNGGNRFHDLDSVKKKGPFEYFPINDPDPYEDIPFDNEMDPYEEFMGPERKKIFSHDEQLTSFTPYLFTAKTDNPLEPNHNPGEIYFVVQMLWRADELIPFTFTYWARYRWVTYIYKLDWTIPPFGPKNIQIYDDDPEPPVIPTESLVNPWFDPVELPPLIIDNMPTFQLDVCAYDVGTSGAHPANWITFGDFNVYDGEYLEGQDELIEWDVYGNDIYAYWYRYIIPNVFEPGEHTVELKVWDKDDDGWPGDRLSTPIDVTFLVYDDDTLVPIIDVIYTGDGTDGNPGELIVTASDASGLSIDPSGTYPVPNSLGTHLFSFTATDNDNDRPNDALTNTVEISIEIADDDTSEPCFENIIINDDHLWLNISFNGIDIPEGDDLGLSIIEIYVDDILIHTYLPTPTEDTFNFSFINEWIFDKGIHDLRVIIVDADNDRPNDALSNEFSETFEVTLDEMYEYVIWQLEELKNYVDENLEGFLPWGIRFLLWLAQNSLEDAYHYFLIDKGIWGLARDKLAQALTHISGFIVEMFNYWEMISDDDAQFIISTLHTIRNNIVFLMGESVGVEQSINIAFIEIDLLNLNDLIHENISWSIRFFLESLIYGAVFCLEGALFKIVLDLSTECMLTSAQIALDNASAEVDDLLNSGEISQELADILKSKIIQAQVDIEMVKNSS